MSKVVEPNVLELDATIRKHVVAITDAVHFETIRVHRDRVVKNIRRRAQSDVGVEENGLIGEILHELADLIEKEEW